MTSRPPHVGILLSALAALLALPAPSLGKCELKKEGGLFSAESFVDSDDSDTALGDATVTITNANGRKIVDDMLRGRLNLSDVRVLVNGVQCNVLYAGPQNQFPGLDQINIELSKSLRGAGLVNVVVEVEGEEANVLQVRIG